MPPLLDPETHGLAWVAEATVAHDGHWSKNRMWLARGHGHARRLNPLARERRDRLADRLRRSIGRDVAPTGLVVPVRQNRLLLALHVAKADHRGDALNVLDLVADAVERATGLDDRWFELAGLTWEILPTEPTLTVVVGQTDVSDAVVCSACGLLLPPDAFRGAPSYQGVCRPCRRLERERARHRPPPAPGPDADDFASPPW